MNEIEQFQRDKKIYAQKIRQAEQDKGALQQIERMLAEEFDCKTVEAGKKLAEQMTKEQAAKREKAVKALQKFSKEYGEQL